MRRLPIALLMSALGLTLPAATPGLSAQRVPAHYPRAKRESASYMMAGHRVADPYHWIENRSAPDTRAWIEAENRFKDSTLTDLPALPRVEKRFMELYDIEEVQPPEFVDGRLYYMKRLQGEQRFSLYVRDGLHGEEHVLLDPATFSDDSTVTLHLRGVWGDNKYLVYDIRQGGEDETTTHIRDLATGRDLPDSLPRGIHDEFTFDSNLTGYYYSIENKHGPAKVYYHTLGTSFDRDGLVFQSGSREEYASVREVDGGRALLATDDDGWLHTDIYLKERGDSTWRPIVQGIDALFHPYWVDGKILALTSWHAPHGHLVEIDPAHPDPSNWKVILPERKDVLDGISLVAGKLFARYLHNASTRIEIHDMDGTFVRNLELPDKPANASLPWSAGGDEVFFDFQSFTYPWRIYLYNVDTTERSIWHLDKPPIDTKKFVVKEEWCESADATPVHMFIVYKKGLVLNGNNPTLLVGYGGFTADWLPSFTRKDAPWVQQDGIYWLEQGGGVFVVANLRGDGEYGRRWHRGGMRAFKQNVFNDFIAVAQHIIDRGYTRPAKLGIEGASNGGLLMGAALTQRPDLFKAVLADLPEMDVIGFPRYEGANPPALAEYGDASIPKDYDWIIRWSPLQNIHKGTPYPAVMLFTGGMDDRVEPAEGMKFVAKLQWATSSDIRKRPVIMDFDWRVGHSLGGRPVLDRIRFIAHQFAFLDWQLGVPESGPRSALKGSVMDPPTTSSTSIRPHGPGMP